MNYDTHHNHAQGWSVDVTTTAVLTDQYHTLSYYARDMHGDPEYSDFRVRPQR